MNENFNRKNIGLGFQGFEDVDKTNNTGNTTENNGRELELGKRGR